MVARKFWPTSWPNGRTLINQRIISDVSGNNEIESYFSDRLTFSKHSGRTSHQIYRLALPLLSPERSLSTSTIAHLALFVEVDDTITRTNTSVSIVI